MSAVYWLDGPDFPFVAVSRVAGGCLCSVETITGPDSRHYIIHYTVYTSPATYTLGPSRYTRTYYLRYILGFFNFDINFDINTQYSLKALLLVKS